MPLKVSRSQGALIPLTGPDSVYCHMVQVGHVLGTIGADVPYCARQNQQFAKVILPLMTGQSKLEKDFRELRENTQGFGLVAFGKPQTRGVAD